MKYVAKKTKPSQIKLRELIFSLQDVQGIKELVKQHLSELISKIQKWRKFKPD